MRRPSLVVGAIVTTLALLAPGVQAAKKLRVVVTIPDLKSLTEAVGGDLVEVDALTRGTQNFHEAEVRPSPDHHAEHRGRALPPLARRPPDVREEPASLPREAR